MSSSLSSIVDNLAEGLYKNQYTDCKSCLIFKCLKCNKNHKKHFNKELIKRFPNTYEFCDGDINTFILLLRKGVHPYEYMDSWKRFNETSLPDKEDNYSHLNMKKTNSDYKHAKNVWKNFEMKNVIIIICTLKAARYYSQMYLKVY